MNLLRPRPQSIVHSIAGDDTLADLYGEYQAILALPNDDSYDSTIEQDLPRTFPQSKFLDRKKGSVRRLLKAFVAYSRIGYVQGMNFFAAASVFFFVGRLPYLSFWLFVTLFDNLKHIYLLPIDGTFKKEEEMFADDTERVVRAFLALYRNKHGTKFMSSNTILVLKNMVQWKIIGTLMFAFCNNLPATRTIVLHFADTLHDREKFRHRAASTALAFLLCCFLEKEVDEEVVLVVQNGSLTEEGLSSILETAENVSSLL